ncbi:MAG TPA: zf-TFIIB domain-containing protein [Armatimonadota bacterium]
MNCPVCGTPLRAIEKYGVEIDICPGCKGVWLDRGELEKILAMESTGGPAIDLPLETARPEIRPREAQPRYRDDHHAHDDDYDDDKHHRSQYDQHGRPQQKRRASWLGDILGGLGGED